MSSAAASYVLANMLTPAVQRLLTNESGMSEIKVLGFGLTAEDIQGISYALTENKTLKSLHLDHLNIGDEGAKSLAQGLCYNNTLEILSLRWNRIGDSGAQAIADALHYNEGLKELILAFNEIGDMGGRSFAKSIQRNGVLVTLDLKWNNISDEAGDMLLDAMADNKVLAELYLGGNGSSLRNIGKRTGLQKKQSKTRVASMRFLSGIGGSKEAKIQTRTVSVDEQRRDRQTLSQAQLAQSLPEQQEEEEEEVRELAVGDLVEVRTNEAGSSVRRGRVAYVGETQFADGIWVGVVFDGPAGKNDGSVNGVRYFTCAPNHGSFLRPDKLYLLEEEEAAA